MNYVRNAQQLVALADRCVHRLARTADPVILPTAHDRGVTLFNRLVARLAREEADAVT